MIFPKQPLISSAFISRNFLTRDGFELTGEYSLSAAHFLLLPRRKFPATGETFLRGFAI